MYPPSLIHLALARLDQGEDACDIARALGVHISVLQGWQQRYEGLSLRQIATQQERAAQLIENACLMARDNYERQRGIVRTVMTA